MKNPKSSLEPDTFAMALLLGSDLTPWVITLPETCSTERGFIWFNDTNRINKARAIKQVRKTFRKKFIHYFNNMIGVEGFYFYDHSSKYARNKIYIKQ